jgi:hypothetical protein
MDWKSVQEAYEVVEKGTLKRADGDGFSVYRAGSIICINIKQED